MMLKKLFLFTLFFLLISITIGYGEPKFESLSKGIVDALSDDEEATTPSELKTISKNEQKSPKSVNLKIEFGSNSSKIRKESITLINELCSALNHEKLKNKKILIKGHTDSDGSESLNQKLSEERAKKVKSYLEEKCGITAERLKTLGIGEKEPIVPNNSKENKQKNRRVEIQVELEPVIEQAHPKTEEKGFRPLR
ncbi:MAG: OmpA family protein [Desulfobacterales bacterium]|nr:OmpA family protein [Desulfobacterales bacterium]